MNNTNNNTIITKYKNMPVQARASLWILVCNIVQAGLNVLSTPIFTRMMSQEEYGYVTAYLSWRSILMIFTSLNLSYGVFNNAMTKYEDSKLRDKYVSSMQTLYCLITLAFLGIYFCNTGLFNEWLGMDTRMVLFLFLDILCYPAMLFWIARQRFEFKYRWLVIVTILMTFGTLGVGVVAVYLTPVHKEVARIASSVIVQTLFCGFILLKQFVKGKTGFVKNYWGFALRFNMPLIPHYLSEMILNQSDRIMITKFISYTAAANYGISYSIITMVQLVMNSISASFVPWSYGKIKENDYKAIKKVANGIMIIVATIIVLLMLVCPEVIWLFAGEMYLDAIYVIPPLAMGVFFLYLYDMFCIVEFYYAKTVGVMIASTLAATSNIILNAIFIPQFGYYAAGYTTLICYGFYAMMHYIFYRRVCRKELNGVHIFDIRSMILSTIVLFIFTIVINLFYTNVVARYGLVILILIGMIICRKKIIEIINGIRKG